MSAINLINLNVDTLFEQHNVAEIDLVQKKIQSVVEQKREELRTMVGERYRDLLKAADTIAAMKESSNTLIAQVDCISANCRSLNEQQLIGFKTDDATQMLQQRKATKQLDNYFSTMIQIKLLTSLPELIWMHIDREHFLIATELFIFSRHISTGLQLDANNSLMQQLPVAKKQWEVLKPFHLTIKQSMLSVLEREDLDADVAVNCLLGLLLLEKSNLNTIFKQFLQLRCAAYVSCLADADASKGLQRRRVKDCILASLKVLNNTMELIDTCFLNDGLLYQKLQKHSDSDALPTVALMDGNDGQFAHMLPEIISSFRPKFETQILDEEQARNAFDQWLTEIRGIAESKLKNLFDLVLTMNTIQEIKIEAKQYRNATNFTSIVEKFKLSHNLNFYEMKYVPLINQRVHDIIQKCWTESVQTVYEQLEQTLKSSQDTAISPRLIWTENSKDLPLSLEAALNEDLKTKKLLIKTKGYDGKIIELCCEFDKQLASIVSEVNNLLEEETTKPEDKNALINFLRETAQTEITNFIGKLKSLHLEQDQRHELLLVVRTCTAIVELCPHLRICFCQQSNWRQWTANAAANSMDTWNRMCALLEEETINFWQIILDGLLAEFPCEQNFSNTITHEVALHDFANWETVTSDQKDEQENAVHSTFRIPNQLRISLQSYLFDIIRALNKNIPQTLPSRILQIFDKKLLMQILQHYRQLMNDNEINQNVSLQLYFDLKFLQNVFAVSREERILNDEFNALQSLFKDKIDPFDFELFAERITANVKRSVVRLQCLIGVLIPTTTLNAAAATSNTAVPHETDPNVLSLSSCGSTTLWFPLLPIITNDVNNATSGNSKKFTTTSETEKQTTSPRKSTTTTTSTRKNDNKTKSFFGAMSQEWFR